MEAKETQAPYTVENLSAAQASGMIPPGATAVKITPEAYNSLSEAQKAAMDPNIRQQLEAALKQAAQVPPNPNHDKVGIAPSLADMTNMAREEFVKMPRAERHKLRRNANEVIGRSWYAFWDFDVKSQSDWAAFIAGAVAVLIIAGVVYLIVMAIKG